MIFFTSDTHFCHNREFVYKVRGFPDIETMNEEIVKRWNSVVSPGDTVYHLGDVMLNDNARGLELLSQLNGDIYILNGNHDTKNRVALYPKCNNVVDWGQCATVVKYGKYSFYLSHYPTMTSNLDNDAPLSQHIINLFGHTHQTHNFYNDIPFMYHVGMDSHNCTPVSAEQVLEDIRKEIEICKEQL